MIHSLNKMFLAARVASRASKTVEVSRLSHAFILQLSMGLVTVALQSATVQNMGKINGFLGHKTRSQAKRVYYYYFFANLTP